MSNDNLNPILNPACECPVPAPVEPTPCPDKEGVSFDIQVTPVECGTCGEIIAAAPPMVPGVVVTNSCFSHDPAYSYIPAQDKTPGSGTPHYFYEVHPACVRPMQNCSFCLQSDLLCPEDVGLTYRKGDNNIFSVMPEGAVQPLLFYVHDGDLDRVLKEVGYVKVAQRGYFNEWISRDCIQKNYVISPSSAFPGDDCFLQSVELLGNLPQIGTLPTVVTDIPVTSVTDPVVDTTAPVVTDPGGQVGQTGIPITPLQLVSDEDPVTWLATGLPAGLTLDPATGIISGTPTTNSTNTVTVTATDAAGNASAPVTFQWGVVN